jgi:hypothetical protein
MNICYFDIYKLYLENDGEGNGKQLFVALNTIFIQDLRKKNKFIRHFQTIILKFIRKCTLAVLKNCSALPDLTQFSEFFHELPPSVILKYNALVIFANVISLMTFAKKS